MDLPVYSTSQPSLCALPVELIQAILCNLPDLESLKSAQLTHSALYFAFIGAESHILKQILAQKIPRALLPDAFFAFDASTVEGVWTQDEVHSIIYRNRTRQISSSFRLNPQSAFKIIRLYRWVRHFTRHFLRQAIADPMQGRTHPPMPLYQPTSSEECRVARALYRFEIHRHLFRMREPYANYSKCSPDFLISDQWGYYFRHFPAWELEQILSVSEYLFRRVAKCLRPFAENRTWTTEGIWYYSSNAYLMTDPSPVGTLLCHGLRYIGDLVTAQTFGQHNLLANELFGKPFMSSLPDIFKAIWESQNVFHAYPSLTCEVEGQTIDWQDTGYVGSDPGPANAWHTMMTATIPNGGVSTQVGSHSMCDLRRQGYVFWDQVRIKEWSLNSNTIDIPLYFANWQQELHLVSASALLWRPHLYYNAGVGSWWYPREIAPLPVVRLPPRQ